MTPPFTAEPESPGGRRLSSRRGRRAFTLLELLVAMAIGALVLVMLSSVATESMKTNRRTVSTLLATTAASAALELVSADLDGTVPLTGNSESLHMQVETIGATESSRLAVLTSSPGDVTDATPASQHRVVLYRLARYDADNLTPAASPANPVYALYRTALSPQATFDAFTRIEDLSNPTGPGATNLFSGLPPQDDLVANNVVDFRVVFYPKGSSTALNLAADSSLENFRLSGTSPTPTSRPITAEVSVTVLSEEGARLVQSGNLPLDEAKRRHGYNLIRRTVLH